MTLKEKVAEIMPERVGEDFYGGVKDCPSSYDFLKGHYGAEVENCSDPCDCEKCWNQPYIENVKVGTKWWNEEEDVTVIITNIDGNNVKYEYSQSFIGSMPKEYLLKHYRCIDDTDINVGNKNEITLQESKLKEIMKQLWQETENVLGHEMVDFYSIEKIIRDVLGIDNSEEESE